MEIIKIVWLVVGFLIIIGIGYYVYLKKYKIYDTQFIPNDEYKPEPQKIECILFYTTWCPHCKQTLKDWAKYKVNNEHENAIFSEIDCDKHVDKADYYQIDSYPTIILLYKGNKYIFDSNFTDESMDKFVSTVLKI